jgi:hypothetical protein
LSPGVGKPQQNGDEPFDMVPDHEIGDCGDRRSFVLKGEQCEPAPKSGLPVQELARSPQRHVQNLCLSRRVKADHARPVGDDRAFAKP